MAAYFIKFFQYLGSRDRRITPSLRTELNGEIQASFGLHSKASLKTLREEKEERRPGCNLAVKCLLYM